MQEVTQLAISKISNKDALTHVEIISPSIESLKVAMDRQRTYRTADALGLPFPKTRIATSLETFSGLIEELEFPIVLKVPVEMGIAPESRC
ncbi:MAG: hypothetical protein NWF14_09230 [Candidatus Bathyarchaeota archaeon]|nr:hypothetical protein [Candidatus Bathyarchaeota archaeon]